MRTLKDAKTAMIVMVLVIIFSIGFGSYRSLSSEADKAEAIFYNGADGDGFGINNDLNIRLDSAYNLVTVARRYLDESDPAIQAVLDARNALSDAENPSDKYDANQRLTEAYTDLSEKLQTMNLSKADEKFRAGLVDELNSRNDTISHDSYNKKAEEYNKLLNAFPANILSRLTGVKPLALFR